MMTGSWTGSSSGRKKFSRSLFNCTETSALVKAGNGASIKLIIRKMKLRIFTYRMLHIYVSTELKTSRSQSGFQVIITSNTNQRSYQDKNVPFIAIAKQQSKMVGHSRSRLEATQGLAWAPNFSHLFGRMGK